MNAFTSSTSFCSALPFPLSCLAEGSQSVKEAHRGLMRTVLAKHVSRVRLCSTLMGVCTVHVYTVCVCLYGSEK